MFLNAARFESKCHDLVENEHNPLLGCQRPRRFQKRGLRRNYAGGPHHRFDDNRRNLTSSLADYSTKRIFIVEWNHKDVVEAIRGDTSRIERRPRRVVRSREIIQLRMNADFNVVIRAVITAFDLDDEIAAGEGA